MPSSKRVAAVESCSRLPLVNVLQVAIDHSIGFTEKSLTTGRIDAPVTGLEGDQAQTGAAAAAALGPDQSGLRRMMR